MDKSDRIPVDSELAIAEAEASAKKAKLDMEVPDGDLPSLLKKEEKSGK